MADSESEPLLSESAVASSSRQTAQRDSSDATDEHTPLLTSTSATPRYDGVQDGRAPDDGAAAGAQQRRPSNASSTTKGRRRRIGPSLVAMILLALGVVCIIGGAFFVPAAVESYAKQAAVVEPTSLSLERLTPGGVAARIRAKFRLDSSRVQSGEEVGADVSVVRAIGRTVTGLIGSLSTRGDTVVRVFLPDYEGRPMVGLARVPPLTIGVRDGQETTLDFVAELEAGDAEGVRAVVNEWLAGRLDFIRLLGATDVSLSAAGGILPLGTHSIVESITVEASNIPDLPEYNITRLNIRDISAPDDESRTGLLAEASVTAYNKFPIQLDVPSLAFQILVPNCSPRDPFIVLADATTSALSIQPRSDVTLDVRGIINDIPDSLTTNCPNSDASPLDLILRQYLHGEATIFVKGHAEQPGDTPKWIGDILSNIILPVPFPGRTFDSLIRNFSLADVEFSFDDDLDPQVSGTIVVLAALPREMNFAINVTDARAAADVLYKKRKVGELNVPEWQPANSSKIESEDKEPMLEIQSRIIDAPLHIANQTVFEEVVHAMLVGDKPVLLDIDAAVDVRVETALGPLVLKEVPAKGTVPVKPLGKGTMGELNPHAGEVRVTHTSAVSVSIEAVVNVTNPTPYSARIPYLNIHVVKNGTIVGDATVEDVVIVPGNNTNIPVSATWGPGVWDSSGLQIGRDLLSQYLSGYNTTVDLKFHDQSIPGQRLLCDALSKITITVAAPRVQLPGDDPDEEAHFIRGAVFHVFSSTAVFTLVSPLHYDTLYLDTVNATAYYNGSEEVGWIEYDESFAAPPGVSHTPKMPVDWSLGGAGYDAVKKALGGTLKLDAFAEVGIRLGNWRETVWYSGKGIGASIRI